MYLKIRNFIKTENMVNLYLPTGVWLWLFKPIITHIPSVASNPVLWHCLFQNDFLRINVNLIYI